ncbi:hypothetical protein BU25DRAFT_405564 [Macroventuria anomochaeta]|uniref:Uncharacterized protein n=1 Tax=Macroventuria anomochaeta TaxID=301207 RepID=A0ACB6SH74_9PLEO|nr:uncharacterized protein BU25DRAFT_405564 [Macroventuria anomochaeta]KAF2633696.1 hypothetical protein BU25DRAFT_405564 [Macroventuria anomochaeta]
MEGATAEAAEALVILSVTTESANRGGTEGGKEGTLVNATSLPQISVPPQHPSTTPYPNHDTLPSHADSRHPEGPRAYSPNEILRSQHLHVHRFAPYLQAAVSPLNDLAPPRAPPGGVLETVRTSGDTVLL